MLLQLVPPLPVMTPKGKGWAHVLIDYGMEVDLCWVVFLDSNGECWTYRNPEIRLQANITFGRLNEDVHPPKAVPVRGQPSAAAP